MKLRKRFGAMLVLVGMMVALMPLVAVAGNHKVCPAQDSGKIDTTGDPASVTVTAPEGYLIDGYCVKAGSESSGAGLEFITVDPPQATVTISHSSGKDVSHYSLSYVKVTDPTTTTTAPTTTTTEDTTTTSEPRETTTTTTAPEGTTTVPEETTAVPEEATTTPEEEVTTTTEKPTELPFTGLEDVLPLAALATMLVASGGFVLRKASKVEDI